MYSQHLKFFIIFKCVRRVNMKIIIHISCMFSLPRSDTMVVIIIDKVRAYIGVYSEKGENNTPLSVNSQYVASLVLFIQMRSTCKSEEHNIVFKHEYRVNQRI